MEQKIKFADKKAERIAQMKRRMSLLRSYLSRAQRAKDENELIPAINGFWHYTS